MEKKWYYAVAGVRHGPVSFDELQQLVWAGTLNRVDLVWQPDFGPEWRNAGQVRELFEATQAAVPPVPEAQRGSVPLSGVTGAPPSCLAAASQAFLRTRTLLFQPFDMTRWFSLGFCAWLAYIGTQTYNFNRLAEKDAAVSKQKVDALLDKLTVASMGSAEVVLVVIVLLLSLLFALWLCSVRSRGDFMFLHRWYRPDEPIRLCWQSAQASGRALFAWRLSFFAVAAVLYAIDAAFAYSHLLQPYLAAGKVWSPGLVEPAVHCVTATVLLTVAVQLVAHLVKAFVVPVMYWQGVSATRAWVAVFALSNQYPVAVLGYLLFGLLCGLAAALAVVALVVLTCCIGIIPLILPYVGTVLLLPIYLFFRGYAVCFLNQWRPELVPPAA